MKKRTKRNIILLVILVVIGAIGAGVYGYLSSHAGLISKELTAYNNSCTIRVPISWEKSSGASAHALIAAENSKSTMYAMVSLDNSAYNSGSTIEDYINGYIQKIADSSDNALVQVVTITPTQATLGDNTGYYFELDTSANGIPVHMWDFVCTSSDGYVHVDVASSGEGYGNNATTAKSIISSLKYTGLL